MKKSIIIIVLVVLFSHSIKILAQKEQNVTDSLQIARFNHSVELDLKDAISISYRNYFSSKWDAAITLSYKGNYTKVHGKNLYSNLTYERQSDFTFSISPTLNYRLVNSSTLNLFFGAGIMFNYEHAFLEYFKDDGGHNYDIIYIRKFGGTFILKIDVDIIKNIKLYGAYNVRAGWSNGNLNKYRDDQSGKRNFIELDKLNLGVGIYF